MGENSPNLVTLIARRVPARIYSFIARHVPARIYSFISTDHERIPIRVLGGECLIKKIDNFHCKTRHAQYGVAVS
jgi:hypothetical protein